MGTTAHAPKPTFASALGESESGRSRARMSFLSWRGWGAGPAGSSAAPVLAGETPPIQGLLDDHDPCLLGGLARLEEGWEVASLAQLGDPKAQRAEPRLQAAVAKTVPVVERYSILKFAKRLSLKLRPKEPPHAFSRRLPPLSGPPQRIEAAKT